MLDHQGAIIARSVLQVKHFPLDIECFCLFIRLNRRSGVSACSREDGNEEHPGLNRGVDERCVLRLYSARLVQSELAAIRLAEAAGCAFVANLSPAIARMVARSARSIVAVRGM